MTDKDAPTIRPSIQRLILIIVGLFLLVPLMGLFVGWLEGPRLEQEAYKALESIAQLKTRQIENWLDERASDGRVLVNDPVFIRLVQAAVENNQKDARTALRQRLLTLLNANHYAAISIIGEQADSLFQLKKDETKPLAHPLSPALNPRLENSQTGMPVGGASSVLRKNRTDCVYYYVSDGVSHIDIAFSLYDSTASASPFATLVLHVALDHFLFPYSNWLPEDSSAETLLVTQSGENVLFITPLRHRQTTMPGTLIRHLNDPTLPAAYALRHGKKGTFEGKDYRGIEVLAAYQAIDGTGWQLIAKLDRDEVMAPLDTLVSWVCLVTLCAAVLIGLLIILLWRQQQRLHASIIQTERHKADMLLRQFYQMPFIGIAITSPTSKYWLRFNDRLCDILGYPREELVEKNWAELTHPDDLEADRANFERLMRHESDGYSMDKRYIRKDGGLVHAYIDVKCVRNADGGVDYFVAMVQDISERKQAETALEEARRQAQRYLDIAEVMIIALDTEGNIQMVNRRGCEILGYPEAELLGKSWFDRCLPAQERDEIKALFGRLMAGDIEAVEQLENRVVTRSGEERIIAWHNTVLRDEHGAITAILSSGMDITVKHVAQQALATSDARLRALVRTIPDPMWLKDGNGVYLTCNPAFERLFGASEAEIVGKSDFDFVDREQAEFFREHDRKAVAAGKASTNEETLTFAVDGYRGIFETTKTPMYDPRGELIGVLGIAHDVTERKHRVAQIEKLSKLYTTLSYTNQAIVHSKNQAELFEKVCSSAVDHGGFTMAWIGLIDAETHMIRPVSIHGEGTAFIENIRLSIDAESPFGGGPTGIALRQRQPYWCQDFLHDEITRPWHEQARETGYAASAVLPVWQQQEVIGSFNLYASEVDAFDEAARALLQEMVADIGFALENFDREARRRGIEQRLDLVIEGSSDAPWDWDLMNDEIYYSPQWWRMFGYGDDELPGDTDIWRQLCHPEDIDRVEEVLLQVQRPGHARDSVESRFRHKDGHYVPILIRGIVSRDEAGNPVRLTGTFMDLTEQKATENRLREQLEELNRWFKATIGREERIIELKQEVNLLLQQRQLPPRYASDGSDEAAEKGDTVNG